jgi:dTDP-4-amino-4,6-dideoxygalactose transaminase
VDTGDLPVTDWLADRVVALPIWSDMTLDEVDGVAEALAKIHTHADAL